MKKLGFGLIFIIILTLAIAGNLEKLNVYTPPSEDINITVSEVETGNKLIEISEVNVILIVMLVGAFLIIR